MILTFIFHALHKSLFDKNVIMKPFVFVFLFIINQNVYSQQLQGMDNNSSIDCSARIDSLSKTDYFTNAIHVNPEKPIENCYISLHSSSGCIAAMNSSMEILFNGNEGYILYSMFNQSELYYKFTGSSIIVEILHKMNETFAFDNTILISYPKENIITGMGSTSFKIDLLFKDGERIINAISFSDYRIYCIYEPILMAYLRNLKKDSLIPLSDLEATNIRNMFSISEIASHYFTKFIYLNSRFIEHIAPRGIITTTGKYSDRFMKKR